MRPSHCLRIAALVLLPLLAAAPAAAQKRVALVVGNNTYPGLGADKQLHNAIGDARLVRDTLRGLGFDVLYGENLDRRSMVDRLFDLAARLGKDDTAFFFFSGHGVSFNGANYLLPSDIPAPQSSGRAEEGRMAEQAISEAAVIDRITASGTQVAIVVLDSCRDNPLQASDRRSVGATRGLAQGQLARGVFSIYSAGIGQTALDRLGPDDRDPNSVFTRVFVEKLKTPGLDLKAVATQTRGSVVAMAQTVGHDQFPAYYDQVIGGDVYLAGRPAGPNPATPPAARPDPCAGAEAHWRSAKSINTKAVLDDHLARFSSCAFASLARARLEALTKVAAAPTTPPARTATSPLACAEESRAKSIEGKQATTMLFKNSRRAPVRIYWLDYQGQRKFYSELAAGQQYVQNTFVTHPWIAADASERCIALYMPEATPRQIEIR